MVYVVTYRNEYSGASFVLIGDDKVQARFEFLYGWKEERRVSA